MAEPPETQDDVRSIEERAASPLKTRILDRYEVDALLGEGGMGEVLDCRDAMLDRRVALKVVRRDRRRRDLEMRFLREACVQGQLEHPGVVPVYDVARDEAGTAFFTMRKITGVTLADVIDEKRAGNEKRGFTRHRLLTAFAQICQTVDYAHARGVLHRDLKPANVMIGDFGELHVLDWGLAKVGAEPFEGVAAAVPVVTPADGSRTIAGTAMGTPAYMAPEQMRGEALDVRADVFALGAMLFEILSLEPLFDERTIRDRLAGKKIAWDARASVRALDGDVPPELDRICVRATAEDRERRYPSVRAMHAAVEAYLGGDRDLTLRRTLAEGFIEQARRAMTSDASDSSEALRLTNRALALAPDDPNALALLVELLKEAPKETAQVRDEVAWQALRRMRSEQPVGAVAFALPWLTIYPVLLLIRGTRDPWAALAIPLAWLVAAGAMLLEYRRGSQERVPYVTVTFMIAVATTSLLVGPFFVVPPLAAVGVATLLLVGSRAYHWLVIVCACLALVVPTFLSHWGVLDVYRFESGDVFTLHGVMRAAPHARNLYGVLVALHLVIVLGAAWFAVRFRDLIERARIENAVLEWHLTMLLPETESKRESSAPRPKAGLDTLVDTELDSTPTERDHDPTTIITGDPTRASDPLVVAGPRYTESSHDQVIGRDVARKRLEREEQAILQARLDHPAIPPVYDLGRDDHGLWITTKKVQGRTLAEDEAPRHRFLAALAQVCLAVDHAHDRGVVHGHLTPQNVVLGAFGEVYVIAWDEAAPATAEGRAKDVAALVELVRSLGLGQGEIAPSGVASARALHDAIERYLARDRDDALRAKYAAMYLAKATKSADEALATSGDDATRARVEAVRDLGRAIAVASPPERAAAQAVLSRLVASPPKPLPPALAERVERQGWDTGRAAGIVSAKLFFVVWLVIFPATALVLGIRDVVATVVVVILWVAAASAQYVQCALMRDPPRWPWTSLIAMTAIAATSLVLGPFLLVPIIAVGLTLSYVLAGRRHWQGTTIALAVVAVVGPSLLAAFGVLDAFHFVMTQPDTTVFVTGCLEHSPARLTFGLLVAEVSTILVTAGFAARFRDELDALEGTNRTRIAHLARILG